MRAPATLRFTVDGITVVVRSELHDLPAELTALYPDACDPGGDHGQIQVEVRATRSYLRPRYSVWSGERRIGECLRRNEVFPYVEWAVNLGVMATQTQFVQLHAASLSYQGNGFIFAGQSGSGKSTLTTGLMSRGWNYLCDEFALIDPDTSGLHPFRKAICIKAGAFPVMHRLGLPFARQHDYVKAHKGRVGYIRPLRPGRPVAEIMAPVRCIVFPRYSADQPLRLEPMSRAQALMELAGCVFNRHAFEDQALPVLARIVAGAECFRLTTGRLEETCALLEQRLCGGAIEEQAVESESHQPPPEIPAATPSAPATASWSRRRLLKRGVKLAYVAPAVLALSAEKAYADGSNPSGVPSGGG